MLPIIGAFSNIQSNQASSATQESNIVSVAKRVESASSSTDLGAYSSAAPDSTTSSQAFVSATATAGTGSSSSANPFGGSYQSFQLGPFPNPSVSSSTASASGSVSSSVCPSNNGTTYTSSQGQNYKVVCDVDYLNNDLRFILASSFDDCVQRCDTFNTQSNGGNKCVGALFVPSRLDDHDDCYLKSSVNNPTPSRFGISAAILLSGSSSSLTSSSSSSSAPVSKPSSGTSASGIPAPSTSGVVSIVPAPTVNHASGTSVVVPTVAASYLQGPSSNKPTTQYIDWKAPADTKLASNVLSVGANDLLSTTYPPSLDTGILELNASTQGLLADLTRTPHISRDGGKGGYLNGQHLFVFCDTGAYTSPTGSLNGNFLGFVSSSVAVDTGMNGLSTKPLTLQDGIGQWSDDVGRMRGFSPH